MIQISKRCYYDELKIKEKGALRAKGPWESEAGMDLPTRPRCRRKRNLLSIPPFFSVAIANGQDGCVLRAVISIHSLNDMSLRRARTVATHSDAAREQGELRTMGVNI